MIPFQKIIAWFLIGLLCFEVTFRVPLLLPDARALEASDHEDIVSLLVEEDVFRKMSSDIDTYARRIQTKLPHTRTVILTYARDAHPYLIASANERLYFSGLPDHGTKTQKLVGTILIGHVPLPVVHKDGRDFLSMYPYTDFQEPHFFWDWETSRYEYLGQNQDDPRPDIWHSVIDPNTGNIDTDVSKIHDFFARVYEFDAKQGRYENVGTNPQVLYMDSMNESRAASKGLLSVYEQIFVPQQENLLYHRFTREFAQYLYGSFLSLMTSEGAATISSFASWKSDANSSTSFLDKANDITTKIFGEELVTPFLKVINEKYLSDLNRWVHNTGRYYNGYSDVRVDTVPELITTKDALSGQIIKESNDVLEKMIDTYVDNNLSLDIPILLNRPAQKTISERDVVDGRVRQVSRTYNFMYDNYFYGTQASAITSAGQCSLIRGSTFGGRSTTVETNHGYNIVGVQDDAQVITNDTNAGIKCSSLAESYWGGNSPMNLTYTDGEMTLKSHRYDDFSLPVLDLAAGKRISGTNSPLDCLRNDLVLEPYKHRGLENRQYLWPTETGGSRYSCVTPFQSPTPKPFGLDPTPETSENILTSLVSCIGGAGNMTLLNRDGSTLALCQANIPPGSTYKRISSLIKHTDPTTPVYGGQLQGNSTPNLPVDEERYLLYLNRSGAQARINYPNLFDVTIDVNDTDDMIVSKIKSALSPVQSNLVPVAAFSANNPWNRLIQPATGTVNLADTILANPDIRAGLIDALRWKQLDVEMKYASVLKTALVPTTTNNKLILPDKKDLYEISYLGGQGDSRNFVFGFSPEEKSDLPEWFTDIQTMQGEDTATLGTLSSSSVGDLIGSTYTVSSDTNPEYSLSTEEISELLGDTSTSDTSDTTSETDSSSDECGDPNGVDIWEWLSAIQCWLSNLMKIEWTTPDIDDLDFPELPSLSVSLDGEIIWSTKELTDVEQTDANDNGVIDYVEENADDLTLTNTLSSTVIEPNQTVRIDTALENSTYRINDDSTKIQLVVTRIDDLDEKKSYSSRDANWTEIQKSYFSVSGSSTLKDGHAVWIFSSKNNHRARITFETRIYSGASTLIQSEKGTILIGPTTLGVTVLASSGSTTSETVIAGDTNGLNILLSGLDSTLHTADITIRDYVTGQQIGLYKAVPITDGKIHLGTPTIDAVIKRASRYTLTLVAGDYSGKTNFTIAADAPHHIDVGLDPLLIKDIPETMTLTLKDIWGNTIDTRDWDVRVETSANIILAPLSTKASRLVTGKIGSPLTLTPLESGSTTFTITLSKDTQKIVTTFSRPILSDAHITLEIPNRTTLEVGQEVPVNFSIQRQDGSIISDWDMSVKIGIHGGNATLKENTLTFSHGQASTTLKTGTRTGTASIYLQDAGLGKIVGDSFTILPGTPITLSLRSPEILYAKNGAHDVVESRIYDVYGNLTTLHGYALRITADKTSLLESLMSPREITTGIFQTDIVSRGYPGRILFHGWLEKDGKKSSIATLENVSETNALPVITSEEASTNSWQNLTQILLGAAFGQTPIEGYFGGSVLFASTTKTLALSTLLDTPESPLFTVTPSGNILTGTAQYGTGIEVKIESYEDNILTLLVYDTRLGSIARVHYPLMSDDRSTTPCTTSSCDRDTMYFTPGSTDITYKDGIVSRGTQKLFSLAEIFTFPNLSFAFVHQLGDNLQFSVSYNGLPLGILSLRWKSRVPAEISSANTSGTYTLEILQSSLLSKLAWSSMSSYETPSLIVYSPDYTSSYLGGAHTSGWSAYPDKSGLGWTGDNTSLLQFAAGQEWSSSIRNHADYLTINLGDPIINLPNYQVNSVTGLDQTLGEPVYMGSTDINDFTFRDTNSDGKKDLITYHPDGTVGMALSRGDGSMIDIGDLLSVSAAQEDMVRAGDFIGDGYADIVYVDSDGVLHQVTHSVDGPIEKPMEYDITPLLGKIEQLEVFDMDHDSIDDIIVMDDIGNLYIFYGHTSGVFRTQLIENVYDFILSDEAKTSYFTGAVRYTGTGFVDPDNIRKATTVELQSKQDQVNSVLFTQIRIARANASAQTSPETLGTTVTNSLDVDENGFLRMYDGNATTLSNSLQFGYDSLEANSADSISVSSGAESDFESFDLLRAPFIIPGNLLVTKQYKSLEESGQVLSGSPIQVQITLKNTSKKNISNILLLEKFADYLSVSDLEYDLVRGTTKETRKFITDSSQSNAGIADLRDITLSPGSSLTLTYNGTLRSFSFGRFDVGYLEDKNDPTSTSAIPKDKVRTINPVAAKLESIPENDFYNHDVYGDIRFNPNETCGGPVLLWRSHNSYDRTYHKTVIVREVANPDKSATELSQDPTEAFASTTTTGTSATAGTSTNSGSTASSTSTSSSSDTVSESESELATWQTDSDSDSIPDKDDDDYGDVFEVSTSGNTTQVSVTLGQMDAAIDEIIKGVKEVLSGLSCGFGDPGCISMPINWAANAPGNTVTLMGYAVPGINTPPVACHKSVLCGTPAFAYPTDCCSSSSYVDLLECAYLEVIGSSTNVCTWPSAPRGAGGALDYPYMGSSSTAQTGNGLNDAPSASGSVSGLTAPTYEKGLGISEYRLWITPTLTGAIAEVMCFGPNNSSSMNLPGMFPIRFDGNCIFATQPLFQCEDDGSEEDPLVTELDVTDELSDELDNTGDDGSGDGSGSGSGSGGSNIFTNADECGFFESIDSYPSDLSSATATYFTQTNDTSVSALQASISENADLINSSESSDSALEFSTTSPSSAYERLNGTNGLEYDMSSGTAMLQIALDPSEMKFKDFGEVVDINLKSIKGFPNFIMDWYQRQMDEIMSSLTHLPDIKIFLPDLSSLADSGWMSGFTNSSTGTVSSSTSTSTSSTGTTSTTTSPATTLSGSGTTTSTGTSTTSGTSSSGIFQTIQSGWNSTFSTLGSGLSSVGSGLSGVLGTTDTFRNTVVSGVQQKTAGIQNAFEYLGTLPIIDVHPESITFEIPWVGKQESQAWIIRNEAILNAWKNLPTDAANSVNAGPMISSIESNIETVRTYLELPERLQTLFYLKEKLLYGVLQNVHAIQDFMGGWLYKNGQRFKGWVEAFILITKLFDLWQVLIDVFNDYEVECGECRNERWNLQHWLWIIISAIIPEIPIIQMPRWPDIELDFSDLDLSLDIAYPVFNLSFYPVDLPDAPAPTLSGFALNPMPQLPQLPDLNIDFDIPVVKLPKLPDLPPPPKVPELSQALEIVLDIFKLLVLIQCLYRKVPLSPEWWVGTKVAHKTERQGYLPFDFLDSRLPTVTLEWIEAIRVSTHVKLDYDVDFIIDTLKDALEPFTSFPKNLHRLGSSTSNTVNIDINPDGVQVQTSSTTPEPYPDLARIPDMIGALFTAISEVQSVNTDVALRRLSGMVQELNISPARRTQIATLLEKTPVPEVDVSPTQQKMDTRFDQIAQAIQEDVRDNTQVISDLVAWGNATKRPEEIPLLATKIPGTAHLAQSAGSLGHLLDLSTSVINPLVTPLVPALGSTISVTPTPDVVEAPGSGNTYEDMVATEDLTKTRGLYVTHGSTTQRLIDYTENLDGATKIHTVDDDGDGDLDVFYNLGNIIYRKENYTKTPSRYIINDAPRVYTTADIYEKFFDIPSAALADIPRDGQISILQNHSAERIRYQGLMKHGNDHTRLRLFRSLFETDPEKARYQVDILPEANKDITTNTISSVPRVLDLDGGVFIEHNKVYRTLITGQQFIDEDGKLQDLSSDFVIRSAQSGYTSEATTIDITSNGKTTEYKMTPGQRIIFAADSSVSVKRGSLLLFANTTEKRALNIQDTDMPLLPGDFLITDTNGGATIGFPDGTKTQMGPSQYWSLTEYAPGVGIKKLSLPVEAEWYYGTMVDAGSLDDVRTPHATIFDAYTNSSVSDPVSQIPTQITLSLPGPTEVDFQSYFPADTVTNIEIFRLPSSQWRRISATKIAFESQETSTEILVRVTASGRVRDYITHIMTAPPTLFIKEVLPNGSLAGELSASSGTLPMGIQSYQGGQTWTLANGFSSKEDGTFTTGITRTATKFSLSQGTTSLATLDRSSSTPVIADGITLTPNIALGKPLSYSLRDSAGERLRVSYLSQNVRYRQIANQSEITSSGVFVLGSGLRLEPAAINDTKLLGGAYITDTSYRPLLTFDSSGVIRTLDTNIVWSVTTDSGHVVFILTRDRVELGRIILNGDMITTWGGK